MIQDTLNDFASVLGLKELRFNDQGLIYLSIEGLGDLYMEQLEGSAVLIYMIRELPETSDKALAKALKVCHHKEGRLFQFNSGLHDDNKIAFSVHLPESDFTVPKLDKAIQALARIHEAAGTRAIEHSS